VSDLFNLTKKLWRFHAASVIIAHNHPGGLAEPSENDDKLTDALKNAL
jgi:DNA repair protein RadC